MGLSLPLRWMSSGEKEREKKEGQSAIQSIITTLCMQDHQGLSDVSTGGDDERWIRP